jgi:hypothetical protein
MICMTQHDSLKILLNAVTAAETRLEEARANVRTAAKKLGISHKGLFGDCVFVYRETAHSWADDARREGHSEGIAVMAQIIKGVNEPQTSPFAHLSPPGSPGREKSAEQARAIIAAGKRARGEA